LRQAARWLPQGRAQGPELSSGAAVRSIGDLLGRFGPKRPSERLPVGAPARLAEQDPVFSTKALGKFFAQLRGRSQPALLDLGPVVGTNVTYFAEQLACKVYVEDLYTDIDRHYRQGQAAAMPEFLRKRFPQADGSVDGILCWDVLDYLNRTAAQVLASQLTRLLRVEGALLGFFGTQPAPDDPRFTKYVVVDEANLRHRAYPASIGRQQVLQNRDILKLFDGLRVSDSFLLQTNFREILFKKPAYLGATRAPI
jgi:hypothetical protein